MKITKFFESGTFGAARCWKMGAICLMLFAGFTAAAVNYDESKVGAFTLPDPLLQLNGSPVTDSNDWLKVRRPQILKLYEDDIYGRSPKWRNLLDKVWDVDPHALGGKAVRKQINLTFYNYDSSNCVVLHVLLYTPANATNRVPVFLCLSFTPNYRVIDDTNIAVYPVWNQKEDSLAMPADVVRGGSHNWKIEETLARGYGIAIVDYNDIEPDLADGTGVRYGVRSLYLKPGATNVESSGWGAIAAWAWGASRVLDYLQSDEKVDGSRVIMFGHSRLGKTALWAAAEDPRFAMVIASCSGEMGAALARRDYGETVTTMCQHFPYWFCPDFQLYSNNISEMPVDSHMLLSLIAPRPVFLSTGSEDRWGDPRGEFEAAVAAQPVFELFGKQGLVAHLPPAGDPGGSGPVLKSDVLESFAPPPNDVPIMHDIGFQTHTGKHDVLPEDWDRFLDFADLHFHGKPPHQYPAPETSAAKTTP
jgi:(4-O-methyl)-D-glucuronate---lignin esterase